MSEFPLAVFVLATTVIGVLVALRYLSLIGYPMMDLGALIGAAGLIASTASVAVLVLAGGLCAPAVFFHGDAKFKPRRMDLFLAQFLPGACLTMGLWMFDEEAGTPWVNLFAMWAIGFVAVVVALLLTGALAWWREIEAASRKSHALKLAACAFFATGAANGILSLMFLSGLAKNSSSAATFMVLLAAVAAVVAFLLERGTRYVFAGMIVVSALVLVLGSIVNGEFSRVLAVSAGIRFRHPVDVFASAEACERVQQLALRASARSEIEDWSEVECLPTGTRMHVEVQVHSGGRWFVQPLTLRGIKVPSDTERLSLPEAALELVVPASPGDRRRRTEG
jgi:hypothetical protein